jgi:hypothetical protein
MCLAVELFFGSSNHFPLCILLFKRGNGLLIPFDRCAYHWIADF